MARIHEEGKRAEDEAIEWYLKRKAAVLLVRNFRCRRGEIDLIFEETGQDLELVFVEVRSRAWGAMVSGLESVQRRKQKRMTFTAQVFLASYRGVAQNIRFDLLAWNGRDWEHYPDLWLPVY